MNTRELTAGEIREIRNLATSMCANYDDHYKECVLLNRACYMTYGVGYNTSALCKYFRDAVLPLAPKLAAIFKGEIRLDEKQCVICGKSFSINGRQAYCSEKCSKTAKRKSVAKNVREYKKRKKNKGNHLAKKTPVIWGFFIQF